eukprot:m.17041 g.17041  ORF g.17041 m.17041 type:complete len:416 (-) comp5882_c0_seq1:49-1296(-)
MLRSLAVLALVASASAVAPLLKGDGSAPENDWVVVFHPTSVQADRDAHMTKLRTALDGSSIITREYSFNTFFGYAGTFSPDMVEMIRADDRVVKYVEADQVMKANPHLPSEEHVKLHKVPETKQNVSQGACEIEKEATWGIVRTNNRPLNIDGLFHHNTNSGQGVSAYVVDTGIYLDHTEFEGRAVWGIDTVNGAASPKTDENGHGTHVAGTIGANKYGIARASTLVAVQVLSKSGSGSTQGVIEGVQFVCKDHETKKNKCVANMSLGGGQSQSMNDAVAAAIQCGCQFAVAAGNDAWNACNYSPASEAAAVTVASSTDEDKQSVFSNHGVCVDLYAPGTAITSTWIGSPYAINTISGTSMASPHVAGIMAVELGRQPTLTPVALKTELLRDATDGVLLDPSFNTPNKLAYQTCE